LRCSLDRSCPPDEQASRTAQRSPPRNAGWLATRCIWGTALRLPSTRPTALACPSHVWVDETRPRNQVQPHAFELRPRGRPPPVIVDTRGHPDAARRGGCVDRRHDRAPPARATSCQQDQSTFYLKKPSPPSDNGRPILRGLRLPRIDLDPCDGLWRKFLD